jgi:hypothetical protein
VVEYCTYSVEGTVAGGAEDDAVTGESIEAEESLFDESLRNFDLTLDTNLLNPFFSPVPSGALFARELMVAEISVMYWFDGQGILCVKLARTMS